MTYRNEAKTLVTLPPSTDPSAFNSVRSPPTFPPSTPYGRPEPFHHQLSMVPFLGFEAHQRFTRRIKRLSHSSTVDGRWWPSY